jgi:hypothetical protein
MAKKSMRAYKFSDAAIQRLERLSERWELSQTTILELVVKQAAIDEDIRVPTRKTPAKEETSSASYSPKVWPDTGGWM